VSIPSGKMATRTFSSTDAAPATGIVDIPCAGHKSAGLQILGVYSATLQFEQSLDNGVTWIAKTVFPALGGAGVTSATGTGQWKCTIGGETHLRVRCSAYTSGSPAVTIAVTDGADALVGPGGGQPIHFPSPAQPTARPRRSRVRRTPAPTRPTTCWARPRAPRRRCSSPASAPPPAAKC